MYLTATCRNPFSYRVEKFVNLLCVNQKYHKIYRKIYFWLWNYPENHSTHSSNFSTKCFSLLNTISLKFQYDHAYISAPCSTWLPLTLYVFWSSVNSHRYSTPVHLLWRVPSPVMGSEVLGPCSGWSTYHLPLCSWFTRPS